MSPYYEVVYTHRSSFGTLPPLFVAGCRAVIGLVPRALFIGFLFDLNISLSYPTFNPHPVHLLESNNMHFRSRRKRKLCPAS